MSEVCKMNYARFINSISAARGPSPLRKLSEIQLSGGPNLISFGTGTPNASVFPFESIEVKTKYNESYTLTGDSLTNALQYGPSQGRTDFVKWAREMQIRFHDPPGFKTKDDKCRTDVLVTPGSQDGLGRIMDMVLSPGDYILTEEPTYPALKSQLSAMKVNLIALKSDEDGLIPGSLLENVSKFANSANPPRVLYIQPNHNNPTGVCLSVGRRREIYQIAQKYDLIIVEDDPYYLLTFAEPLPPSFLSMDVDGRVLRLDSFSKVMAAGMRIGFVTAAKPFIERLIFHLQVGSMECASFSQLFQLWGMDKFVTHSRRVAQFYESQCDKMLKAADKHLQGLAEWTKPKGGMFMWLKVLGVKDTNDLITKKALDNQIVLAPGCFFMFDSLKPTPFMRASFSNVDEAKIDEGFRRLADLIRKEQKL